MNADWEGHIDEKKLKGASRVGMSVERKSTIRNLRKEQNWKDNLPQPVLDFLTVKIMKRRYSDEEEQEIQRQQEALRKLSEAFYEGLDDQ